MKRILIALVLSVPFFAQANCFPIEWGGSGTSYTVGTTTSGTWYVWNCLDNNGKLYTSGKVIVAGHKPSATCLAAIVNPFVAVDEKCSAVDETEVVKYNRIIKSMRTAMTKLPK